MTIMPNPTPQNALEKIPEESVEHMVTVLYCWLGGEEPMTGKDYKKACAYVREWVKYRLPKKLRK
jgi:hypothetical protein